MLIGVCFKCMQEKDFRSKTVVFVSQCILNQNLRFPGIAVAGGACRKVVEMLLRYDLGIEPIPCLERLGWGGVTRKSYFRYQNMMLRSSGTLLSGTLKCLARIWIFRYSLLCRREAKKITRLIEDYRASGYSVIGIISMNDSPTDGVTRTIDLVNAPEKIRTLGINPDLFKSPDIVSMKEVIQNLCEQGTGIFISSLQHALERKRIAIKMVGFDPWADHEAESQRIEQELGLTGMIPSTSHQSWKQEVRK